MSLSPARREAHRGTTRFTISFRPAAILPAAAVARRCWRRGASHQEVQFKSLTVSGLGSGCRGGPGPAAAGLKLISILFKFKSHATSESHHEDPDIKNIFERLMFKLSAPVPGPGLSRPARPVTVDICAAGPRRGPPHQRRHLMVLSPMSLVRLCHGDGTASSSS